MKPEERFQFIRKHFQFGTDLNGHVIEIDKVVKCPKLCSCHDPGGHGCNDQWIFYHLTTGLNFKCDECVRDLKEATKPVLLKPDNVFEVY